MGDFTIMSQKFGQLSFSQLNNAQFIEEIYAHYLKHPEEIDVSWRRFFEGMEFASEFVEKKQFLENPSAFQFIEAYRSWGFVLADINPLREKPHEVPELLLMGHYGFEDSAQKMPTHGLLNKAEASIGEIEEQLKKLYSARIGYEFKHIYDANLKAFIQSKVESELAKPFSVEDKKRILHFLNRAEFFESFLHTKFVGQKRFSIEGLETFIPLLRTLFDHGGEEGVEEMVICMAHRGRLNVLVNIFEKPYSLLFYEFGENYKPSEEDGTGDVKYHKGYSADVETDLGKRIHISIPPNSSHLESVNAVALGQVRAKQTHREDKERKRILSIQVHGDASVAGQGVIYENMQLYNLEGYKTGGSIHIIMDNQIGFTTLPKDDRSTRYPSDIAKSFDAPVFHVNAEDPEGCVLVSKLAIEVRQKFKCDVFIHLNGYRKYGHNEGDEPSYTQPLEYQKIRNKKSIREIYSEKLVQEGVVTPKEVQEEESKIKEQLQKALDESQHYIETSPSAELRYGNRWSYWKEAKLKDRGDLFLPLKTGVDLEILQSVARQMTEIPSNFVPHKKIAQLLGMRRAAVLEPQTHPILDWGLVENLAYGTLLLEGFPIRLAGQDSRRGTFSHRHAVIVDQNTAEEYISLNHLSQDQALFQVYNSPLSEYACLGFEYGYSISTSKGLILWEAQFGDFSNGAQIAIDAYLATGEDKWNRLTNLVLLLPHGYEGQGPEHSSARIERYLELCGKDNMIVVNPSTPAQHFHLLRRQAHKYYRKPLIVFSPKSLLRHPQCVSSIEDLRSGSFQEILDDPQRPKKTKKLVFCSGQIYYTLIGERERRKVQDMAIVRIEQLYPMHTELLSSILDHYKDVKECFWVQEEPENMGPWGYMHHILEKHLPKSTSLNYCGRLRGASPSEGTHKGHKENLKRLLDTLFEGEK